jgi:hypothetical protein
MFKFEVNHNKKLVQVTVSGSFDEVEAGQYIKAYQDTANSVKPSEYALYVDGREQKVVAGTLVEDMQGAVGMYLATGYKRVIVTLPKSAVASMQIKRIQGYEQLTFVNSPEEALALV